MQYFLHTAGFTLVMSLCPRDSDAWEDYTKRIQGTSYKHPTKGIQPYCCLYGTSLPGSISPYEESPLIGRNIIVCGRQLECMPIPCLALGNKSLSEPSFGGWIV